MIILGSDKFTANFFQVFNESTYQLYKTHAEIQEEKMLNK